MFVKIRRRLDVVIVENRSRISLYESPSGLLRSKALTSSCDVYRRVILSPRAFPNQVGSNSTLHADWRLYIALWLF